MKSFNQIHNKRIEFLRDKSSKDHVIIQGNNNVIISAPHGVDQVRLGRHKVREIGSIATSLFLQEQTNCYLIAKTKNNYDDANFDKKSSYKQDLLRCIEKNNIKYVVDIHGLAEKRGIDVNFGTHLGQNIKADESAFENLYNAFIKNNFVISIDQPFMGGGNTISHFIQKTKTDVFSLQIEINCAITNKKENFNKYQCLLKILVDWINHLK